MRLWTTLILSLLVFLISGRAGVAADRYPTSPAAKRWRADPGWLRGAFCIHNHESVDWHRRWVDWAGRPSRYAGGMQFLQSTWRKAGGRGEPWQWSPREQLFRAFLVWKADGGSWRLEWGTARACGLR